MIELDFVAKGLADAKNPEDFFGSLSGTKEEMLHEAKTIYRHTAYVVHPDRNHNRNDVAVATEAFKKLDALWSRAQQKITDGTYGTPDTPKVDPVVIKSRKREYTVGDLIVSTDIANLYHCNWQEEGIEKHGIFKVARDAVDNEFIDNEGRILKLFDSPGQDPGLRAYVSTIIEAFAYKDTTSSVVRSANIQPFGEGLYSIKEVLEKYPNGIDPKHVAWMWGRLLLALGYIHENGVIHGAILPPRVLIHPEFHGLVLTDFTYSVHDPDNTGERIQAISPEYEAWYPPEVFKKELPLPGLDIYMGARLMVALLGGDPVKVTFPDNVPNALRSFFRGSLLEGPYSRPQDAWALREEFRDLIERLWGERKFLVFSMK